MTTNPQHQISEVTVGMAGPSMITTIIPTFRRPELLRRAIKSVLAQTYPHIRVCVYDDASNDGTAAAVEEIIKADSRVSYYCHPNNIGSVSNYNFAFKNIRTPFFSLLGDDDILLPGFYEIAIRGLHKYPEAAFYATATIPMEPDGTIVEAGNWSTWGDGYYLPPEGLLAMCENNHLPPVWTGMLFRTIVIEQIGLLDEGVGATYDHDYSQRIAAHLPYAASKVPGAIYLINPASMSAAIDHSMAWADSLKMIRNLTDDNRISLSVREQVGRHLMNALTLRVYSYGKQSILSKRYDGAYKLANILYRHLDAKLRAFMIYVTTKCCQHSPYFHTVLLYSTGLRHRLRSQRCNPPSLHADRYAQYLNEP